ncbi:TRAP transporter small permease [Paracoccaceae bacterium GXU_MW_L88]
MTAAKHILGGLCILLMLGLTLVTCIDVVGRYVLNAPLTGAYELTQVLLGALVFAALPLTTAAGSHVEVDLALHLLPEWVQRLLGRLAGIGAACVLAYFGYRLVLQGNTLGHDGARTSALSLPLAPLAYGAALSCFVSALIMLLRRPTTQAPALVQDAQEDTP